MELNPSQDFVIELVERYPVLQPVLTDIRSALELLRATYQEGGKLLVCGNGGSASDSEHIVGELMKGYMLRRPLSEEERRNLQEASPVDGAYLAGALQGGLPAISLVSQTSLVSAVSNDTAPDMVFAQQVWGYGRPGDALLAISTSGNARNVILAVEAAKAKGMRTVGLTAESGGALRGVCDVTVRAPASSTPIAQEYHIAIYHAICAALEAEFFDQ